MQAATARKPAPRQSKKHLFDASKPLNKPNREHFAQLVADMVPVKVAYERCGYAGGDQARTQLRCDLEVDARVKWLLANRVRVMTEASVRGEKKIVDSRLRLVREFERIAYSSLGDVVAWDRTPILGPDGSIEGFADELTATPSKHLPRSTMAAIKSVTTKAGNLKIDMHDKLNAMNGLAKILGMTLDAAPVAQSVTVNQINVGATPALELARRVAFLLGQAGASSEPATIEHQPTKPAPKG